MTGVYSEGCVGATTGMMPMVPRATVTDAGNDGTNITVDFTVSDPNAYNAWMWLNDSVGTYVGRTELAVDWASGALNSAVLAGGKFDKTGSTNTFDIQSADIVFYDGAVSIASTSSANIILTDGAQYAREGGWDYRSISATLSFRIDQSNG